MKPTTKQRLTVFLMTGALAYALTITGANAQAQEAAAPVVAIDILLKPDATMVQHATAINDRLRTDYPKGFSLDASHRAHVSLAQRYVRAADLPKVYDAVAKVLAGANVAGMKLEAYKYYYIPVGDLGLQGIVVKPSAELLKLQQAVIDAVTPFALKTGRQPRSLPQPMVPSSARRWSNTSTCSCPNTPANITCRMSRPVLRPRLTSTRWPPSRSSRSRSRQSAWPFTIWATTGRRRQNSRNGI